MLPEVPPARRYPYTTLREAFNCAEKTIPPAQRDAEAVRGWITCELWEFLSRLNRTPEVRMHLFPKGAAERDGFLGKMHMQIANGRQSFPASCLDFAPAHRGALRAAFQMGNAVYFPPDKDARDATWVREARLADDAELAEYPGEVAQALADALEWAEPLLREATDRLAEGADRRMAQPDTEAFAETVGRAVARELRERAGEGAAQVGQASRSSKPRRRRRPPQTRKVRELTGKQTEAMQIVGECKGNFAEAARRLSIDRTTLKERYQAACKKVGTRAVKYATKAIGKDHRGQEDVAGNDDGPAAKQPGGAAGVKRDRRK